MPRTKKSIRLNQSTDASLDVDVQTTFMPAHGSHPDGGLAVSGGHEILPVIFRTWDLFAKKFATCDRHPRGHISLASSYEPAMPYETLTSARIGEFAIARHAQFGDADLLTYLRAAGRQVLWPDHALERTTEGELHPDLSSDEYRYVQVKGMDPACDSYSGFRDNLKRPTGLKDVLKKYGVRRIFIRGLAYDFCVGWTALDAVAAGFEAFVIDDATRSVDQPGTVAKMDADLAAAGVKRIQSSQLSAA